MKSIIEKTLDQLNALEKVSLTPDQKYSRINKTHKSISGVKVKIKVDASDEANQGNGQQETENIFSAFNQSSEISSLKIDVRIDEDPSGGIVEGGEDTVFGQGTNPKPEDETYLNLLKKSTPTPKVKINPNK